MDGPCVDAVRAEVAKVLAKRVSTITSSFSSSLGGQGEASAQALPLPREIVQLSELAPEHSVVDNGLHSFVLGHFAEVARAMEEKVIQSVSSASNADALCASLGDCIRKLPPALKGQAGQLGALLSRRLYRVVSRRLSLSPLLTKECLGAVKRALRLPADERKEEKMIRWHMLLRGGPIELQLPHKLEGVSILQYLRGIDASAVSARHGSAQHGSPPHSVLLLLEEETPSNLAAHAAAEDFVWEKVRRSCDVYRQRMSVVQNEEQREFSRTHELY